MIFNKVFGNTLPARVPFYYGWVNLVFAAVAMVATLPGRSVGIGLITEPLIADLGLSLVYGSSDTLYPHTGYMPELIMREDMFTRPKGMYAVSKIAGEAMLQSYHQQYGVPTVSLTIPYTFCGREILGERTLQICPLIESHVKDLQRRSSTPELERVIQELKSHYDSGTRLVIPHCPEGPAFKRHLGDVRDVVTPCERALDVDTPGGEAFVIMSEPFRFEEAVPHLSEVSGLDFVDVTFPFAEFYEYDMQHTTECLQFVPEYDGKMMLEDAWRHKQGEDISVVDVGPNSPTVD